MQTKQAWSDLWIKAPRKIEDGIRCFGKEEDGDSFDIEDVNVWRDQILGRTGIQESFWSIPLRCISSIKDWETGLM